MGTLAKLLTTVLAVALLVVGGVALGASYRPDLAAVDAVVQGLLRAASALVEVEALGLPEDFPERLKLALGGGLLRFGATGLGLLLLVGTFLLGRKQPAASERGDAPGAASFPKANPREAKKVRQLAARMARKGQAGEAAEICLSHGLLEEAAKHFVKAEDFCRAAEICYDQQRFIESAELHLRGGNHSAAGLIFGEQEEFARSADSYLKAGNQGVAAEMFERAGDYRRAANHYSEGGFARPAAEAYVKCEMWGQAASCFEAVILEERTGASVGREREIRKLVMLAGKMYGRAGQHAKAESVLEKGECFVAAAEVAQRHGREAAAADLYLKGREPARAAEVLRGLGKNDAAALILAEYHRDHGDDSQAVRFFEEAGEFLEAADLYRQLDQFEKAGECYERQAEYSQAAEMFCTSGDRGRAGLNFERAGEFSEAAECFALAGNEDKEAELLERAGAYLRAGEICLRSEKKDEAISVLQRVEAGHADYCSASALLGEIFRERGMISLALTKLKAATEGQVLARENLAVFYALAAVYEANQDISEAADLYERILACDYHFKDVEERLGRTREVLKSETAPTAVAPSAGASAPEGRYQIIGTLGRGGMGIVYKAKDAVLDRVVALKMLPETLKENPQALKNFLREAKSAARLNHPNIVTVYDAGEQDGNFYIAMEYVDGNTLKDIVKRKGKIAATGIVHVLVQMSEALAYAHSQKVVHRDIKSANTMWTRDRKAKIMDFGLAKVIEEVRNHTTVVSGTPYYMSPEQTLGKNVDWRSDIYSLGVTVFELATGTLPFTEGNLPYHHLHTPPPDPRSLVPDLPPVLVEIINTCLKKDPADRYQSAGDLIALLKKSLG